MIGNAHIDPAWLWRWPVGVGEALSTSRTACDLLDEFPEFVFTRGEAWLYERIDELDGELFSRIREHVATGRWAVVGGWYIQPDCNLLLGESFRRHMAVGLRHARERLGVTVTVGYNVDSFGHAATLPRLLAESGYDSYVMSRPAAAEMTLPGDLFRWRSAPGGAEIMTWRVPFGYGPASADLTVNVEASIKAAVPRVDHVMCFYGVGDHGGGPTRAQLTWIENHRDAFPGALLVFSHPRAFFDAVKPSSDALPIVTGELHHHAVGCYSVVRSIKTGVRRAEHALLSAEAASENLAASPAQGVRDSLERAWKQVLFNQFHDVYGGTSLPEACDDAVRQLGAAAETGYGVLYDALYRRVVALPPAEHQRIVIYNPSTSPFNGHLAWEPWLDWRAFEGCLVDDGENVNTDGAPAGIPYQSLPPASTVRSWSTLLWRTRIPAGGLRVLSLREDIEPAPAPADGTLVCGAASIANGRHLVVTGKDFLVSIPGMVEAIDVTVQEDPSDTWGHDIDRFAGARLGVFECSAVQLEERGPLRAALRVEAAYGKSTLAAWARLYAADSRVELEIHLDWRERMSVAKLVFALPGTANARRDGIPDGAIERPQDGKEYPLIDWTTVSAGSGRSIAVACPDCFALSGSERELALTLVRSPPFAWHHPAPLDPNRAQRWTDQGEHHFRFVLRCGPQGSEGSLQSEAAADAMALHRPPMCVDWTRGMKDRG